MEWNCCHRAYSNAGVATAFVGTLLLILIVLTTAVGLCDDDSATAAEYELKAEYLWRITLFVEWPDPPAETSPPAPFVIGVLGASPIHDQLVQRTSGEKIKGRPVNIQQMGAEDDLSECHIIFIAKGCETKLEAVLERTDGEPILTVSESAGFAERGVQINLFLEDEKVRFEINQTAVRRSGLVFGSKLYKIARLVGTGAGS